MHFMQHLSFDTEVTAIRFDADLLSAPIVQNSRTLKPVLRTAPQSVFLRYKNDDSWTARIRGSFGNEYWPVFEALATEFHLTPTTLRRRLESEGSSYQGIKEHLRRDAAIHRLCTTALSIADIGRLLGLQEPSAFHRALKKWCGVQPGQYGQAQATSFTPIRANATSARGAAPCASVAGVGTNASSQGKCPTGRSAIRARG